MFESYTDLELLVQHRTEETVRLEFKRELPESGKNDDMARDLAAMANAEGGTIVYGIEQDSDGRAAALRPFQTAGAPERVALVGRSLDEPLTLTAILALPTPTDSSKGLVVVDVRQSDRAPHFFKGSAWGRTARGNVPLTRRQIGELYARSEGFAEEFGLKTNRPARIVAEGLSEGYSESDSRGRLVARKRFRLRVTNEGENDAFDVAWEWILPEGAEDALKPKVMRNPFPLSIMHAGARVELPVSLALGSAMSLSVKTNWRNAVGELVEMTWPVVW